MLSHEALLAKRGRRIRSLATCSDLHRGGDGLGRPIRGKQHREEVCNVQADLKTCGSRRDLQWGRSIHARAVQSRNHTNAYVATALIKMYNRCGSMVDARRVFDNIQQPNVVSWTALLLGYAENGEGRTALDLFSTMKARGCTPDSVAYVAAFKACTSLAVKGDRSEKGNCLELGRRIHLEIGFALDHYLESSLIDMYCKCGSMADARCVFDSIEKPDVVSWSALLSGYADNGQGHVALDLFSKMKGTRSCVPDSVAYIAALKSCTSLALEGDSTVKGECLQQGREIHAELGSRLDHYLQNTLIDMYAKCGSMVDARRVFDTVQKPSVVFWNVLISGYAENGEGQIALDLFSKMKARGCAPNPVTYVAALKACTSLARRGDKRDCLEWGKEIHCEIGCHLDHHIQNTLIDMYVNCGSIADAHKVFDSIQKPDVVSWSALLLGYADNGDGQAALDLFSRMKAHGCAPDPVAYVGALKACSLIGALALGRKLHAEMSEFNAHVVTCLVDFYAKCGSIVEAREVFDLHSTKDVSTWNALLAGYGSFGGTGSASAFTVYEEMQDAGFQPDAVTFSCMLLCCSHAGLVEKAKEYFEAMASPRYRVTPTIMQYTCMVDVLGRANQLKEAFVLLRIMPCSPDAVTWMSLLGACRKWKNVQIGMLAFQSLVDRDKKDESAHILMAQIYGSRGMLLERERMLETRVKTRVPGEAAYVVDEVGKMVKFVVGEQDLPEVEEKLEELCGGVESSSLNAEDGEQLEAECGHCERRAAVYGILKTPPGEAVRVFKNTRMCDDCHVSTKAFSKLAGRVIMVRDAARFHVMVDGTCSCGEYW